MPFIVRQVRRTWKSRFRSGVFGNPLPTRHGNSLAGATGASDAERSRVRATLASRQRRFAAGDSHIFDAESTADPAFADVRRPAQCLPRHRRAALWRATPSTRIVPASTLGITVPSEEAVASVCPPAIDFERLATRLPHHHLQILGVDARRLDDRCSSSPPSLPRRLRSPRHPKAADRGTLFGGVAPRQLEHASTPGTYCDRTQSDCSTR